MFNFMSCRPFGCTFLITGPRLSELTAFLRMKLIIIYDINYLKIRAIPKTSSHLFFCQKAYFV